MEKVLDLTCIFREYKTLLMASNLFYVPTELQPVQIEVRRKKQASLSQGEGFCYWCPEGDWYQFSVVPPIGAISAVLGLLLSTLKVRGKFCWKWGVRILLFRTKV